MIEKRGSKGLEFTDDHNQLNDLISIILCSHNRAEHLKKTLHSLYHTEVPQSLSTELVLVDNASTDTTYEVMYAFAHEQMRVRVVREERLGLSNARNRGVAEAEGTILLFSDDDVRFPRHWIERMCLPILRDETDAVAGGVELASYLQTEWMTPYHRELLASTEMIDSEHPDRIVGANMAISRRVFDKIPGFDPELGAGKLGTGEETLFSLQMREYGFRIKSAFDVSVEHHPDLRRLSRTVWKETAKKVGKSEAYLSYHWEHRQYTFPALYSGLLYYHLRLWLKQILVSHDMNCDAGIPLWEFQLRRKIHRIRQHIRERGNTPKYNRCTTCSNVKK